MWAVPYRPRPSSDSSRPHKRRLSGCYYVGDADTGRPHSRLGESGMAIADLDIFFGSTLDILLADASILHVLRPTTRLMLDVFRFERDFAFIFPRETLNFVMEADKKPAL